MVAHSINNCYNRVGYLTDNVDYWEGIGLYSTMVSICVEKNTATAYANSRCSTPLHVLNTVEPAARPVFKWAGGKQWLSPIVNHLLPRQFSGTLYEPFAGGASFFFAVGPKKAVLSDLNPDLMDCYSALRANVEKVIGNLARYPYNEHFYYRIRSRTPRTEWTRAARLIYLNRSCWNGLFRVNQAGQFNVPFGRQSNPSICDRPRLRKAASLLDHARLQTCDFESAVETAVVGDLVYFDPPYITGHRDNGFLKYNAHLFSWNDQKRLAKLATQLSNAGVHVLVSNADHRSVRRLYSDFYCYRLLRNSLIGGKGSRRGTITEVLFSSYDMLESQEEF